MSKSLTRVILTKGFEFMKTENKGSALFKKNKHYLIYHKDFSTIIFNHKSEIKFDGWIETEEELDVILKTIKL
jgi:hypothetical protein